MEDESEVHFCFGMSIKQNRKQGVPRINQRTYLTDVLKKFGVGDCKPLQHQWSLVIADAEEPFNIIEYQSAISGLIYVSVATRPDLPYA